MKLKGCYILINILKNNYSVTFSKYVISLVILLLITNTSIGYSQIKNFEFERIGMEQGLSQNTIESILQDDKGFMWFASQNGLNKYDGYKFTIYFNSITDSNSISSSNIRTIYKDSQGDIWIGFNGGGLDRYNKKKDAFEHYSYLDSKLSKTTIYTITESKKGNLWFGTEKGLYCLIKKKNQLKFYKNIPNSANSLAHNYVMKILESNNLEEHILWIGTRGGLSKFNVESEKFTNFKNNPKQNSLTNNIIKDLYEDTSGNLWIATRGGLNILNTYTEKFINYQYEKNDKNSLPNNSINSIYKDTKGLIWIGTHNGLSYIQLNSSGSTNVNNLKFTTLKKENYNSNSLSNNRIASVYEDKNGLIWIGTYFGGVNKLDKYKNKFTTINKSYLDLNENHVSRIF